MLNLVIVIIFGVGVFLSKIKYVHVGSKLIMLEDHKSSTRNKVSTLLKNCLLLHITMVRFLLRILACVCDYTKFFKEIYGNAILH